MSKSNELTEAEKAEVEAMFASWPKAHPKTQQEKMREVGWFSVFLTLTLVTGGLCAIGAVHYALSGIADHALLFWGVPSILFGMAAAALWPNGNGPSGL